MSVVAERDKPDLPSLTPAVIVGRCNAPQEKGVIISAPAAAGAAPWPTPPPASPAKTPPNPTIARAPRTSRPLNPAPWTQSNRPAVTTRTRAPWTAAPVAPPSRWLLHMHNQGAFTPFRRKAAKNSFKKVEFGAFLLVAAFPNGIRRAATWSGYFIVFSHNSACRRMDATLTSLHSKTTKIRHISHPGTSTQNRTYEFQQQLL